MSVRIVRLGSPRATDEGVRFGTVRRPPRGVPKTEFASRDYYDVWLPALSPSAALLARAKTLASQTQWSAFARRFRAEMNVPAARQLLDALAELSASTNFSVGCYCEDERRCHRSLLRALFEERGAAVRKGDEA